MYENVADLLWNLVNVLWMWAAAIHNICVYSIQILKGGGDVELCSGNTKVFPCNLVCNLVVAKSNVSGMYMYESVIVVSTWIYGSKPTKSEGRA